MVTRSSCSDDPDAAVSGGYWYHRQRRPAAPAALDGRFQDALVDALARLTGVHLS